MKNNDNKKSNNKKKNHKKRGGCTVGARKDTGPNKKIGARKDTTDTNN